jgi:hypothetical protein
MGEPPVRKLARVEPSGGLDLDGRSVFEAPIEFGVTGRRMADGKATFQAESARVTINHLEITGGMAIFRQRFSSRPTAL